MAKKPSTKAAQKKKVKKQPRRKESKLQKFKAAYVKALSKKSTEGKVGRPTKYLAALTCEFVEVIIETMGPRNFFSYCSVEHVAEILGVHRDTVYDWNEKHPEFAAAMNHWEQKRNALFYPLTRTLKPAIWIFLAKNWLGLKDEQISKFMGEGMIVQYVSHIPEPRTRKGGQGSGKKGKGGNPGRRVDGVER